MFYCSECAVGTFPWWTHFFFSALTWIKMCGELWKSLGILWYKMDTCNDISAQENWRFSRKKKSRVILQCLVLVAGSSMRVLWVLDSTGALFPAFFTEPRQEVSRRLTWFELDTTHKLYTRRGVSMLTAHCSPVYEQMAWKHWAQYTWAHTAGEESGKKWMPAHERGEC